MKINPERLSSLRQKNHMTRKGLAERSGIAERTIQRLENEPQLCQKTREDTVNRLAKALGTELGVLTGELPFTEYDKASAPDPERIQIGAQIAPKARLAYDLIKGRYGVSATEIINMAPLFFALLAEGSLAWRREKLKEAKEVLDRLEQIDEFWDGSMASLTASEQIEMEKNSIAKADLFREHLFGEHVLHLMDSFDPSTDNPFASYLRKLKAELAITDGVDVDSGDLMFGSPLKFPDYDICRGELDSIADRSRYAKMALETGHARLSEIPEELMAEDAGEKRAKWLEDRLPDTLKDQEKKIEDLEKGMKDLEKEIKEKDDKIEEMGRPETYLEGVSEEEFWRERFKEFLKENEKQNELKEELGRLKEKHREEQSRLEMIIKEERDRITSLSDTIMYPEGDLKGTEEADSQETNSDTEKGGDDQ